MDRIIGKGTKYSSTAVLLPVVKLNGIPWILFEIRSSTVPQPGEVCFPGGMIDKNWDATPEEAAIRETMEELGVSRDKIEVREYIGTLVAPVGATVDAFMGDLKIKSLDELNINSKEVQSVFMIPVKWFRDHPPETYHIRLEVLPYETDRRGNKKYILPVKDLDLPAMYHEQWPGKKLPVYFYRTEKALIWGITAEIVKEYIGNL